MVQYVAYDRILGISNIKEVFNVRLYLGEDFIDISLERHVYALKYFKGN